MEGVLLSYKSFLWYTKATRNKVSCYFKYLRQAPLYVVFSYMKMNAYRVKSKIHTCECGIKFLRIKEEEELGYTRVKCPFCINYKHNGKRLVVQTTGGVYRDEEVMNRKEVYIKNLV